MANDLEIVKCLNCGKSFPDRASGSSRPCPQCGATKPRQFPIDVHEHIDVSDTVEVWSYREYYRKHRVLLLMLFLLTIASAFVGLVFTGALGVIIGLVIGLGAFFLGPKAMIKVEERRGP